MRVVQDGVRQTYHLTVGLVGVQDARADTSDIFCQRHHQFLTDRVDGGVRDLRELLTEVVEEDLRFVGKNSKRGVVTHRGRRLLTVDGHRCDRSVDVFLAISEHLLFLQQMVYGILDMTTAL